MNRQGYAYLVSLGVVLLLTATSASILMRGIVEKNISERALNQTIALHLAEAGTDDTLARMRDPSVDNWNTWSGTGSAVSLAQGNYQVMVTPDGAMRRVRATGETTDPIPSSRTVELWLRRYVPPNFYDNAIYAAGLVDFRGNSYLVDGHVLTAQTGPIDNPDHIVCADPPCVTQDPAAAPLPRLSFAQLYQIAQSQGNVYTAERLAEIQQHRDSFPSAFCYAPPAEEGEPCTPNVNYITTDLVLNGNIGIIGGFFVVVGSVITNPDAQEDTTINGNGEVEGVIYTTGDFIVNGGGGGLNVNGGVLAGDLARMNGNATVQYNPAYMEAIEDLQINPDVQVLLWHECPLAGCPN